MIAFEHVEKSKLSQEEIEAKMRHIVSIAFSSAEYKRKDILCYHMYNGTFNERDFDYLRKVGEYEYPAKVRWIPRQRPKLDLLRSQLTKRPFNHSVYTVNKTALQSKLDAKIKGQLDFLKARVDEKISYYTEQIQGLNDNKQKLQELVQQGQQQGQQDQEAIQQLQQLQQQLPMIMREFDKAIAKMGKELKLTDKEVEKIDRFYKYDYKDIKEQIAQKALKYLRQKLSIDSEKLRGFTNKLITGKEQYLVDYRPGDILPTFKAMNILKVYYPGDENVRWIQEGDWVVVEEKLSASQIVEEFGSRLNLKTIKDLQFFNTFFNSNQIYSVPGNGARFDDVYYSSERSGMNITIYRCFWQEQRMLREAQIPNKKNDITPYFTHIVDSDYKINKEKGEREIRRYVNDLYQGVVVGRNIVLYAEKAPIQLRSVDNYSKIELPIFGKTFNSLVERPLSLIWSTKDLQILSNIVHYHRELLIAISGVKGFVMDMSQKPAAMSMEEWQYQRKIGTAWIETVKKGVRVNSQFNQFKDYDDTLTPAIQYLDKILENLDYMMGDIMGIPRQALGMMTQNDGKGTSEMSLQQSQLRTEILFWEHDEVIGKCLTRLLNLCGKQAWKDGFQFQFYNDDLSQELVNIPKGALEDVDVEVVVANNTKEEQNLNTMRQLLVKEYDSKNPAIRLEQVAGVLNIESTKELEKKLAYYSEQAQEIASNMQQNASQAELQAEQTKMQMQSELDGKLKQMELQYNYTALEVEKARLELDKQRLVQEMSYNGQKLDADVKVEQYKAESERQIESTYLVEQNRASMVDEQIRMLQLKINALLTDRGLTVDKEKHTEKMVVEKKKAQRTKEKVKD